MKSNITMLKLANILIEVFIMAKQKKYQEPPKMPVKDTHQFQTELLANLYDIIKTTENQCDGIDKMLHCYSNQYEKKSK
jgi:hypothetical protein